MVRRQLVGLLLCTLLLGASRVLARGGGGHGGHGGGHGMSFCGHSHHARVFVGGYGPGFSGYLGPTPIVNLDVPPESIVEDEPTDSDAASAQYRYDHRINDD